MKTTDRQRAQVLELFTYSDLKASQPNLVLSTYEHERANYYTVGTYEYDPQTGRSRVHPLPDCKDLSHDQIIKLLNTPLQ